MGTWLNDDGLYIKYNLDEGVSTASGGEYKTYGPTRQIEVEIDLTDLTATSTIINDVVMVPANAQIESVEVVAEVAATGTGAVLNVGLVRLDRTTTYDSDGFVAAAALSTLDTVGEKTAGAGTLVGTILANAGLIVADRGAVAAFTDGRAVVRVNYRPSALSAN